MATSTITAPRFMVAIISRRTRRGGGSAGYEHRTHYQVGRFEVLADGPGIGGKSDDLPAENVVQLPQAVEVAVDDSHVGAHPDGHLGGVDSHDASAQDHHVGRRYSRHAAQQDAAAAIGFLQILRAHLDGHASGHLAHGREQGQGAVAFNDGLISYAIHFGGEQPVGELGERRQVQVGEQDEPRPEVIVLGLLRLFDFDDQAGAPPHFRRRIQDSGAGLDVLAIRDGTALAGPGLDKNLVTRLTQGGDAAGHQPDARLVVFDFLGDADNHEYASEFRLAPLWGGWYG